MKPSQKLGLIETIQIEITNEYNTKIASKIITAIEEDGFDDESIWDDIQDEDESSLKDKMELNQFKSLKRICKQFYDPTFIHKPLKTASKPQKTPKPSKITLKYNVTDWNSKQNETRKIYLSQCPLLIGAEKDNTLMNTATLGRHNNMPLITYFVDTFNRYRIENAFIDNNNNNNDNNKLLNNIKPMTFINNLPFYKQLYDSDKRGTKIHSILETYQARFAPKILLNPEITSKFNDNLEDILRYIYGVSQMLESIIAANKHCDNTITTNDEDDIIPFQFDLVIIPHGCYNNNSNKKIEESYKHIVDDDESDESEQDSSTDNDEDDDDDDDEFDQKEQEYQTGNDYNHSIDQIGKIIPRLNKYNIKSASFKIEQTMLKSNASAQIKRKFNEQFKEIRKGRHGRYVMIVDRRDNNNNNDNDDDEKTKTSDDNIYIYSPKCESENNKKDKNCYHNIDKKFVDESLIYKTTKCLIPGLNEEIHDKHIGSSQKELITLSFHILSVDLIKCYLYINGGGTRFEPSDLITILPRHFKNIPTKSRLLDEKQLKNSFPLKLEDEKFYNWYKQTTQKKQIY